MSVRIILQRIVAGLESFVPWKSDAILEGVALVKVEKAVDIIYEIDHTGDTNATEFGPAASADGVQLYISDIAIDVNNTALTRQGCLFEYWNGSDWNRLFNIKTNTDIDRGHVWPASGRLVTGFRDTGENFFRITNSDALVETFVTILAREILPTP